MLVLNQVKDKTKSVTNKPWISTTGRYPCGQSHSLDTELWRVSEISNMFDILLIHRDKLGNYN